MDFYAGHENRSVIVNGVKWKLPEGLEPGWYDVVAERGEVRFIDCLPDREKSKRPMHGEVVGCIRVDTGNELRNFNTVGPLTLTTGEYVEGPPRQARDVVWIDFQGRIPPRTRGIRVSYDSTISTASTGTIYVRLSPDAVHWVCILVATKQSAAPLPFYQTTDIFFRRQLDQKIAYTTLSSNDLDAALTVPKFHVHGWWL